MSERLVGDRGSFMAAVSEGTLGGWVSGEGLGVVQELQVLDGNLLVGRVSVRYRWDILARDHGQMITIDLVKLATDEHVLVRRPQCERCGDPTLISGRDPKVTISSRPVVRDVEGGLRARPAGQVFEQLRRHVSPIIGAVTWLVPAAEVEDGLTYSYRAGHNFAMVRDNMDLLKRNLRGQSGGKGRTDLQARVSAVGEAIERYSGV